MSEKKSQEQDWCVVHQKEAACKQDRESDDRLIDLDLLNEVFPKRNPSVVESWFKVLAAEEIRSLGDVSVVAQDEQAWGQLGLPLATKIKLRQAAQDAIKAKQTKYLSKATISMEKDDPIQQLDCIVLDVSASMKARSAIDALKTREDVSKLVFLSMVDGILSLEMDHAVSLVAFGKDVSIVGGGISRHYEHFQDELGRLDADQGRTRLYDGIIVAANLLLDFKTAHADQLVDNCPLRIFALTDGMDNASSIQPWKTVEFLQKNDIILDSFPMAGHHPKLQAASAATGGVCVNVTSEEQAVGMFQREALLHILTRREQVDNSDIDSKPPRTVTCPEDLDSFIDEKKIVVDVCSTRPSRIVNAKTTDLAKTIGSTATSVTNGSMKRILKEYYDIATMPAHPLLHYYPLEGNASAVKIVLEGPANTPYQGYFFGLSGEFPADYPWKPLRVRFLTPVYHCNINRDGAICLDILKDQWSPALSLHKVMISILSLLEDPNASDPLDPYKAQLFNEDKARYHAEAQSHTHQHAFASIGAAKSALSID